MFTIDQKADVLLPFSKIGDKDWTLNTRIILESLAENWGSELPDPIAESEILKLENRLGTALPKGLSAFYTTFGLADIGEQLQPFDEIGWLKDIWAEYPEYGPSFSHEDKLVLPYLITFSDYLGNGNIFCFHSETKEIYYFDHDTPPLISKLFDTVDDYIKGCLIFAQADLFGDSGQDAVDKWTEEIVSELFTKAVVQKWMY